MFLVSNQENKREKQSDMEKKLVSVGLRIEESVPLKAKALAEHSGITICALIKGDIERCLHRRFASLRVFGEWFRDDGSIANFISQEAQS